MGKNVELLEELDRLPSCTATVDIQGQVVFSGRRSEMVGREEERRPKARGGPKRMNIEKRHLW